jgi:hypothetical protein
MKHWLVAMLIALSGTVAADEIVPICYGYSCIAQDDIHYSGLQIGRVGQMLSATVDAATERKALAEVIGQLYAWAGEQSDVKNDRGGNVADGHSPGRMDCIDHSTSTTRLLQMLEAYGFLRWHQVSEIDVRNWAFVFPAHYSAVIEEKASAMRFVVDSWFVDNGQPAVILPLGEWKKGAGPDV